jgi:hypothetical protein
MVSASFLQGRHLDISLAICLVKVMDHAESNVHLQKSNFAPIGYSSSAVDTRGSGMM